MPRRYAHAKQFKRVRMINKKIKPRLGRIVHNIKPQLPMDNQLLQQVLCLCLAQTKQLITQQQSSKAKLYPLYTQESQCISKGKAHKEAIESR